jgi:hypothetical protein
VRRRWVYSACTIAGHRAAQAIHTPPPSAISVTDPQQEPVSPRVLQVVEHAHRWPWSAGHHHARFGQDESELGYGTFVLTCKIGPQCLNFVYFVTNFPSPWSCNTVFY